MIREVRREDIGECLNIIRQSFITVADEHANGDYKYECRIDGDFEWFQGRETISYKGNIIYECYFHGGLIE